MVPWVSYQTLLGILIQAPFAIGMSLISLAAMAIPAWFTLQWTMSLVTFLQVPFFPPSLPPSLPPDLQPSMPRSVFGSPCQNLRAGLELITGYFGYSKCL